MATYRSYKILIKYNNIFTFLNADVKVRGNQSYLVFTKGKKFRSSSLRLRLTLTMAELTATNKCSRAKARLDDR